MRRSPLRPGTKRLARRTRLKPISDRTRAKLPDRAECRRVVLERAGGRCELPCDLIPICDGRRRDAVDVDEIKMRSRGGSPFDPANCRAVCRDGHRWITDHTEAIPGLVAHSWE